MSGTGFRHLHVAGAPLLLLNAWDVGSGRVFEAAGAVAIGTTSAGIAFSRGCADGEVLSREDVIGAAALIICGVSIPVSVDIEAGFGARPEDVGETVRRVIEVGGVGVNLEDANGTVLYSVDEQIERLAAARGAAEAEGVDLFINARTDVFLQSVGEPQQRAEMAIDRLRAYHEVAGGGVFLPGVSDATTITTVVNALNAPLNILAGPGSLTTQELAALGAARISMGSAPSRAALGLTTKIATEFLTTGTYQNIANHAITYKDANSLFE